MSERTSLENLVVAIDGPAGSGKSTVARRVAEALSCTLLDTGALYRSLALLARERGVSWDDGPTLAALAGEMLVSFRREGDRNRVLLAAEQGERDVSDAIRAPEVSLGASRVSAIAEVRAALLEVQRAFARRGALVAEGRDMGTVVFPRAALKVFLVADPEVRARRRHEELLQAGREASLEQVLSEQRERDEADSGREVAPLKPAAAARSIDTSTKSIDEVVAAVLELVPR